MELYLSRANIGTTEKNLFRKLLVFPSGNPSALHTVCCVSKKNKNQNTRVCVYYALKIKSVRHRMWVGRGGVVLLTTSLAPLWPVLLP